MERHAIKNQTAVEEGMTVGYAGLVLHDLIEECD
jgi:hypothetical protein